MQILRDFSLFGCSFGSFEIVNKKNYRVWLPGSLSSEFLLQTHRNSSTAQNFVCVNLLKVGNIATCIAFMANQGRFEPILHAIEVSRQVLAPPVLAHVM